MSFLQRAVPSCAQLRDGILGAVDATKKGCGGFAGCQSHEGDQNERSGCLAHERTSSTFMLGRGGIVGGFLETDDLIDLNFQARIAPGI